MVMGILEYSGQTYFGLDPIFTLLFAFYLIFIPVMLYIKSTRNFASNKRIQQPVIYEFTADKMFSKGERFNSELAMDSLYRIEETRDWFLVYQSKQVANLIPKREMTDADLSDLRRIFRTVPGLKLKLRD
ncbi:hypothetical protein HYN48_10470 [Flavobacterium magnum]|uniref:YcxB-like C-terminal domain-containing protein n=2 Tax=Flavobacterium magnum TaxID=2162713 RepID=A0A2S0RFN7_9FLAO|nr:hypothetical protein HYN48_10470 [Flavobacterium magnum]